MIDFLTEPGSVPDSRLREAFAQAAMVARRRPARANEVGREEALGDHLEQLVRSEVVGQGETVGGNRSAFELLREIASVSRR